MPVHDDDAFYTDNDPRPRDRFGRFLPQTDDDHQRVDAFEGKDLDAADREEEEDESDDDSSDTELEDDLEPDSEVDAPLRRNGLLEGWGR